MLHKTIDELPKEATECVLSRGYNNGSLKCNKSNRANDQVLGCECIYHSECIAFLV